MVCEKTEVSGNCCFGYYRGYSSLFGRICSITLWEYFNAVQLEKMRFHVEKNHLDRERVVMTNLCQAIEFCLKTLQVHAGYRKSRKFSFMEGHKCKELYDHLPDELKKELKGRSIEFCKSHEKYVQEVNTKLKQLEIKSLSNWDGVGSWVESNPLSRIHNANDPVLNDGDWFEKAINNLPDSVYYRYGTNSVNTQNVPDVVPIHYGITPGRFFL